MVYFWAQENRRKSTATAISLSGKVVAKFFKLLNDVCSHEIKQYSPFIPFGGPGCIVQCDESKFNHKAKVSLASISTSKAGRESGVHEYQRGRKTTFLFLFIF